MAVLRWEQLVDNKNWKEVDLLNGYAVFIGYISMAVKGLGYLVITWTTVVLLGGFVSMLPMKDFWCLTFITLIQTTGIFNATLNENLKYMLNSVFAWMMRVGMSLVSDPVTLMPSLPKALLRQAFMVAQLLLVVIILCPLATIYMFGILMSGGISLWRLIEHDYRGVSGGEASNLMPAMDTLYCLALLQAMLFSYKFILDLMGMRMVMQVANNNWEQRFVENYLQETKKGCEKDPSFVKGRNLITHAVNMIASNSPVDCISGVKMLSTAIGIARKRFKEATDKMRSERVNYHLQQDIFIGHRMLMKHLLLSSASSKHILQKLLETLDSRGVHDSNTRNHAARIVDYLACNINLEQFPEGIYHISSMIMTFEEFCIAEPYQRDYLIHEHQQNWDQRARCLPPSEVLHGVIQFRYMDLLWRGLSILGKLAAHKNNCRVISDTPDLVTKIMAPVTSDLLHNTTGDHGTWHAIVYGSMKLMNQLATGAGETRAKLRREISSCQGAISTLWRILKCNECSEGMQIHAISILKHLYRDTETSSREDLVLKRESREDFVRMLLDIFTHDNKFLSIRTFAGAALREVICFRGGISDATIVIKIEGGNIIDSLTEIVVHDKDTTCSRVAAIILEHLCTHYTEDDEYLWKLKKSIANLLPEVLGKILSSGDDTDAGIESVPETDVENKSGSTHEMDDLDYEEKKLRAVAESIWAEYFLSSLLSLCGTVCGELAPDLAPQFHTLSFVNKLKDIVVKHSDLTAENLSVLKSIGKMVIAMMKHNSSFVKQGDIVRLIEALSGVSKNMVDLDLSMIFRSTSSLETMSKLERRTLASLVKEAKELHVLVLSASLSG